MLVRHLCVQRESFWCLELCVFLFDCLLYAPWAQSRRGTQRPHYYYHYCYSSSELLQFHYTVLLSSFLLPFFMHLLMSLFTFLYFSDPSGSHLFFLSCLLLSHGSRLSAVTLLFSSSYNVCQGSHRVFQSLLC